MSKEWERKRKEKNKNKNEDVNVIDKNRPDEDILELNHENSDKKLIEYKTNWSTDDPSEGSS